MTQGIWGYHYGIRCEECDETSELAGAMHREAKVNGEGGVHGEITEGDDLTCHNCGHTVTLRFESEDA